MHVGQPAPALAQLVDAGGRVARIGADRHRAASTFTVCPWSAEASDVHQLLVGVEIGAGAQMHLVDGLAGLVEELQAAPDLVAVALLDREAMRPDLWKDAQVDLGRRAPWRCALPVTTLS